MDIHYTFQENLRILDLERVYRADFTVFSKTIQDVNLKPNHYLKGIKFLGSKKIVLQQGINNIQFYFMLRANYGYNSNKKKQEHNLLPEPAFLLESLQIVSEGKVSVNEQSLASYKIASQQDMEQCIRDFFKQSNSTNLYYLYGQSGVGKSHVLSNYITSKNHSGCYCLYCEMSGDYQSRIRKFS